MTELERLEDDLRFVRGALDASDRKAFPSAIYFLWAAAVLAGFLLVDFRPGWVGWYWLVAGPAGFLISLALGWRHARTSGQVSATDGRRELLHWGGMMLAIGLALLLPSRGGVAWESVNAVILLIVALGYFTAGVHGERAFLWLGALMAGGYLLVMLTSAYAWTIVGVSLAVALVVAGLRGGRAHEAAP